MEDIQLACRGRWHKSSNKPSINYFCLPTACSHLPLKGLESLGSNIGSENRAKLFMLPYELQIMQLMQHMHDLADLNAFLWVIKSSHTIWWTGIVNIICGVRTGRCHNLTLGCHGSEIFLNAPRKREVCKIPQWSTQFMQWLNHKYKDGIVFLFLHAP